MPKRKTITSNAVKRRYDAKTYARYTINLRHDTDANLISRIEAAKAAGLTVTDFIRENIKPAD